MGNRIQSTSAATDVPEFIAGFKTEADAQACYDALFAAAEIGKAIPCQAKSVPGGEG